MSKTEPPVGIGSMEVLGPLPKAGPICYAMAADVLAYRVPRVGKHLPGVYDVALWSTDQMRAYALAEVQRAVGAMMSRCQGKKHDGCAYLGHCGMLCNKCGQVA